MGEASLMLQEYRDVPDIEKFGEGVSICLCAMMLYRFMTGNRQGTSNPEPFVGNNLWVVQLKDPDGYNILFESPTEVPEETMYSDWVRAGDKRD